MPRVHDQAEFALQSKVQQYFKSKQKRKYFNYIKPNDKIVWVYPLPYKK